MPRLGLERDLILDSHSNYTCLQLQCLCLHVYHCHLVDALKEIVSTMGATYWKFDADSCNIEMVGVTLEPPDESERRIGCDCSFEDGTVCHVVNMYDYYQII